MRVDLRAVFNVRSTAQVRKVAGCVDGNGHGLVGGVALFVGAAMFKAFNEFQFVGLVFEELFGFGRAEFAHGEDFLLLDKLTHTFFDEFKVIGGQAAGQVKVVVKAISNSRADGDFGSGEHLHDRFSHDVGG